MSGFDVGMKATTRLVLDSRRWVLETKSLFTEICPNKSEYRVFWRILSDFATAITLVLAQLQEISRGLLYAYTQLDDFVCQSIMLKNIREWQRVQR